MALSPAAPGSAGGTTYIVNSSLSEGDGSCDPSPGDCTLRDAILAANSQPESRDVITFDPLGFNPDSPLTISPGTPLPGITSPVGTVVDGTGAGVIIDGSLLAEGDGLLFHTSAGVGLQAVTVRNIEITNFPENGIKVCAGAAESCADELLDTLIEGVTSTENDFSGIFLNGRPNQRSTVLNTVASSNGHRGININAGTALIDATVEGTTADNNDLPGINLNSGANNEGSTIIGSEATGNESTGIVVNAGGQNIGTTISDTISTGNAGTGINVNSGSITTGATIEGSTSSSNGGRGININAFNTATLNTVTGSSAIDNGSDGVRINATVEDNTGSSVLSTIASGNGGDGVMISAGGDLTDVLITGSTFHSSSGAGILIESKTSEGDAAVHFNRIAGNTGAGVNNHTGISVAAQNNWWGCNEGPDEPGCDTTLGEVNGDPWLVLEVSRPVPALIGLENPVTGSVTVNSDGEDTSGEGHITDGTLIFFETDQGSIGSTTVEKPTEAGVATALLVPDTLGTANVSATLDSETVSIEILVVQGRDALWGDIDCNDSVSIGDALKIARHLLDLSVSQDLPCPEPASLIPVDGIARLWGDADCNGTIAIGDALKTARHLLELSVDQEPGCPEIGSTVQIPE
jgi:hypothetical protein